MRDVTRIAATAALAALLGCTGTREEVSPAPSGGAPTLDAGTTGSGGAGGAPDAGVLKRTVIQRNPFGNVAETENLLWDGDFEWYSPFSDQYGWLAGTSAASLGFTFTDVKLGAACHSGIRCAWLKKHHVIAGIAVASQGNKLAASLWAHVTEGPCSKVVATLGDFEAQVDPDVVIPATSPDPDATGWCRYGAVVDARAAKPVLFVQNNTAGDVLVDDAVIKKAPTTMSLEAFHGPPSAELAADLESARAAFRKLRGPHDPPPNPARRAYEQWKQP